mgnify:CR=1 FL=1
MTLTTNIVEENDHPFVHLKKAGNGQPKYCDTTLLRRIGFHF